jgi:cyclase
MSLARRVIPCLDVAAGRVVKGVNFENLRDMGDPVELAALYFAQGADELTFLDVTATVDDRATTYDVVRRTAEEVFIPLTVGGGVRSADDVARLLGVGADKVGVNSAAIARPDLIGEIADRFGAQVLVLSLDVKRARHPLRLRRHDPRRSHRDDLDALDWAREAIDRGAGELLVNSIDADGTKDGFDLELVGLMREISSVPSSPRAAPERRPLRPGRARGSRRGARGIRLPLRAADDRRRQGRAGADGIEVRR